MPAVSIVRIIIILLVGQTSISLFVLLGLIIFAALYGIFWKKERVLTVISIVLIIFSVAYFEYKNINHSHDIRVFAHDRRQPESL